LGQELIRDCGEARLEAINITTLLNPDELAALFDQYDSTKACALATAQGAGILLAVQARIDPDRRGKTMERLGATVPCKDTDISFSVITIENCGVHYNNQFREVAGDYAVSILARKAASKMIITYLDRECPAISLQ